MSSHQFPERARRRAQLLTVEDVATMLGMGTDWVYAQVRGNRIPHVRLGRYVRFRAESIEQWICELERGLR